VIKKIRCRDLTSPRVDHAVRDLTDRELVFRRTVQ